MSNTGLFTDAGRSHIAALSLIIVYEGDQLEQYAQMLKNHIDILQEDSSVAIFTAKQYVDNRPTFDSQKILFIGNGDVVKVQAKAVDWKFGIYAMQYGWKASRCVLTATYRALPKKKSDELLNRFSEYCMIRQRYEFPSMFQQHSKLNPGFFDVLFEKGYATWQNQYELLINVFLKYGFPAFMNGENLPGISYDADGEKMRKTLAAVFSPLGIPGIAFLAAVKNNGYAGGTAISEAFHSLDSGITANIITDDISRALLPAITELGIYYVEQTVVEEQYKKYKEEPMIDEIKKLRLPEKIRDTAEKMVHQILIRHRKIGWRHT